MRVLIFGAALKKNGQDQFNNHEQAIHDHLDFRRHFSFRAKTIKVCF